MIVRLGFKYVVFDKDAPKQHYLEQGHKEAKMSISTERMQSISHMIRVSRKQYRLKHSITRRGHDAMGETFPSMAT